MKQQTLAMAADQSFENYRKPTRRDEFLKTMEAIVPWSALCAVIEPFYPKAGNGRPPIGLERMLRIHFIQHWFNLADMACEDALYDSVSLRRFFGIDLGCEPVPDSTTITKFRKLLNDNKLGEAFFAKVGKELHGNERRIYGDSAYASQKHLIASKAPKAKDFTNQRSRFKGFIDGACQEPQQVTHPGTGGACVWRGQAPLGIWQSALPWPAKERDPGVHGFGTGQHLPRSTKPDGTGASMNRESRPKGLQNRSKSVKAAEIYFDLTKRSRCSLCTSFDPTYSPHP